MHKRRHVSPLELRKIGVLIKLPLSSGAGAIESAGNRGERLLENIPFLKKDRTDSFSAVLLVCHCDCEPFQMFVSLFTSGSLLVH